jgi:hypothetical protein
MAKKHHARSNKRSGAGQDITVNKAESFPITVKLDPDMQAVPLIRALSLVGLKLTEKDGEWWLSEEPAGLANRLPVDNTDRNFAENALLAVESAESLMSVAALALRRQDIENDAAIADTLENHVWGELDEARRQLHALLGVEGNPTGVIQPERTQVIRGFGAALSSTKIVMEGTEKPQQPPTITDRIEKEREKIFSAMATVALVGGYSGIDESSDLFNIRIAMNDCYEQLDGIASELNVISTDAREDAK